MTIEAANTLIIECFYASNTSFSCTNKLQVASRIQNLIYEDYWLVNLLQYLSNSSKST